MLVMWFKDNNLNPFYSYDARKSSSDVGSHWSESTLSGRVSFLLDDGVQDVISDNSKDGSKQNERLNESISKLKIHKLKESDQGIYRCRVDFKQAPTFHSEVVLEIFVPPAKPLLIDEDGNQVINNFGPFFEGEQVTLSCEVTGGRPKPYLSWLKNGEPIKAVTEVSSGSVVTSKLSINGLRRTENNQSITCLTNNNDLSPPIETTVQIVMNLPPLSVTISNKLRKLLAGVDYSFSCLAQGFSPTVEFRWFLGDVNLAATSFQQKEDISLFQFQPSIEDHGRTLRCQALNPFMPLQSIQDTLVLDIYYKPVLTVSLGHGIDQDRITEGSDVYLECRVKSRPNTDHIVWMKDDSEVRQDLSSGRLVSGSGHSLVLQNISRIDKGNYSCVAQNSEGRSSSNFVEIKVKYRPICRRADVRLMAVSEGDQVMVPCRVSSNPPIVNFQWFFNSSSNKEFIDLPSSQFVSNGTVSLLQFNLHSRRDYGTVQCVATNIIGRQLRPCYIRLIPKDVPSRPSQCTMVDIRSNTAGVECVYSAADSAEHRGAVFVLELYQDSQLTQLQHNSSNSKPKWNLEGLSPGKQYHARIYVSNVAGHSQPVLIKVATHQESSRFLILPPDEEDADFEDSGSENVDDSQVLPFPLKAIMFGMVMVALILVVFSVSVGAICRIQCKFVEDNARLQVKTQSTATSPIGSNSSYIGLDMNNPTHQSIPPSPTSTHEYFPHHQHLYPSGSQTLFTSPNKAKDSHHSKSTDALIGSETTTFHSENVSFSSLEMLSGADPMLPSLAPLVVNPAFPSYFSTLPRQRPNQVEVGQEREWTPRKLEKQRSVTFASIDLLEPIDEDFPQESRV